VYFAPGIWAQIFGNGTNASLPNTYEWAYEPFTSSLAHHPLRLVPVRHINLRQLLRRPDQRLAICTDVAMGPGAAEATTATATSTRSTATEPHNHQYTAQERASARSTSHSISKNAQGVPCRASWPGWQVGSCMYGPIDPRDTRWEVERPAYRVYFWQSAHWASRPGQIVAHYIQTQTVRPPPPRNGPFIAPSELPGDL
jgi:hypothetical protein